MSNAGNSQRRKSMQSFRTVLDIGMGLFYVVIGLLLIIEKRVGMYQIPPWIAYILGTMMLVGGAFRFYRGIVVVFPGKSKADSPES